MERLEPSKLKKCLANADADLKVDWKKVGMLSCETEGLGKKVKKFILDDPKSSRTQVSNSIIVNKLIS